MPYSTRNSEEILPSVRTLSPPSILNVIVYPYREPQDCPVLGIEVLEIAPDCDNTQFYIAFGLNGSQPDEWLTPECEYTVNGGLPQEITYTLGVPQQLGPFNSGDIVRVYARNSIRPECTYISDPLTYNCFQDCPIDFPISNEVTTVLNSNAGTWEVQITLSGSIATQFVQVYYEKNGGVPQILNIATSVHTITPLAYTDVLKIFAIPLIDNCPILQHLVPVPSMPDPGFNSALNAEVLMVAPQPDGKIVLSGLFTAYGATPTAQYFTRLNSNGSLDAAFNTTLGFGFDGRSFSITVQPSGRIIGTGNFGIYNGNPVGFIIAFTSAGTIDPTFLCGTGFDSYGVRHVIDSSGNIYLTGSFRSYNGSPAPRIAKLSSNGILDTEFVTNAGAGGNHELNVFCLDNSGRMIIMNYYGGYYDTHQVQEGSNIGLFRVNSDGSFDSLLAIGTKFNSALTGAACASDNGVIVTGLFTEYNGSPAPRIVKLNDDGTINTSFMSNIGTGFNGITSSVYIHPVTQKIYIGCWATEFDGNPTKGYVKLNSDGTRDLTFLDGSTGFNDRVLITKLGFDFSLVVGGSFFLLNGQPEMYVTKLSQ